MLIRSEKCLSGFVAAFRVVDKIAVQGRAAHGRGQSSFALCLPCAAWESLKHERLRLISFSRPGG